MHKCLVGFDISKNLDYDKCTYDKHAYCKHCMEIVTNLPNYTLMLWTDGEIIVAVSLASL